MLNKHPGAQTRSLDTLLTTAANAATEATRLRTLYSTRRDVFLARAVNLAALTAAQVAALDLNALVTLSWPRFGLDAGKLVRVLALDVDYATRTANITLWG